jgi:hypothetical protein
MKRKYMLLCFMVWSIPSSAYAQAKLKKDTLYYQLHINKAINSQLIISVDSERTKKFYTINCFWLKSNHNPIFRCDTTKGSNCDKNNLKHIKLIKLATLVKLLKQNTLNDFIDKYAVFFIQPEKKGLMKYRAYLQETYGYVVY